MTAAARGAFLSSFERIADPEGILPVAERMRRAEHLKKAHFLRLAMKSASTRKARARPRPERRSAATPTADHPDSTNDQDSQDPRQGCSPGGPGDAVRSEPTRARRREEQASELMITTPTLGTIAAAPDAPAAPEASDAR
ncbi:MAG: hypothetical protein NTX54_01270 [Chloroflexi bacterium]|nr:hypothetical protein [Chloroflexota bacterium]